MTYNLLDPEVQVVISGSNTCERTVIEIREGEYSNVEALFPARPYFLVNEFGNLLSPKIRMTEPQAEKLNNWLEAKGVGQRYIVLVEQ